MNKIKWKVERWLTRLCTQPAVQSLVRCYYRLVEVTTVRIKLNRFHYSRTAEGRANYICTYVVAVRFNVKILFLFYLTCRCLWISIVINLFNFFRHNNASPFHADIAIHLISYFSLPIYNCISMEWSKMLMLMLMLTEVAEDCAYFSRLLLMWTTVHRRLLHFQDRNGLRSAHSRRRWGFVVGN